MIWVPNTSGVLARKEGHHSSTLLVCCLCCSWATLTDTLLFSGAGREVEFIPVSGGTGAYAAAVWAVLTVLADNGGVCVKKEETLGSLATFFCVTSFFLLFSAPLCFIVRLFPCNFNFNSPLQLMCYSCSTDSVLFFSNSGRYRAACTCAVLMKWSTLIHVGSNTFVQM